MSGATTDHIQYCWGRKVLKRTRGRRTSEGQRWKFLMCVMNIEIGESDGMVTIRFKTKDVNFNLADEVDKKFFLETWRMSVMVSWRISARMLGIISQQSWLHNIKYSLKVVNVGCCRNCCRPQWPQWGCCSFCSSLDPTSLPFQCRGHDISDHITPWESSVWSVLSRRRERIMREVVAGKCSVG